MQDYIKIIENSFDEFLQSEDDKILEAMAYSLKAPSKRLRPILLLEFAKILGVSQENAMPYAVSIEMIHTYSLIHDDLPCMDDDDFRRGKPTNHKVYGEALALLAGDGLLNLAFETMSSQKYASKFSSDKILKVISEISTSTGVQGMISGQVLDINDIDKDIKALKRMHLLKTGKLIKCACVSGAILGGASDAQIKSATDFAINLGIAFQIRDDILDIYGDSEILGKPIGSDESNNKITYATFYNKEKCDELVEEYTKKAIMTLDSFENTEFLVKLAQKLVKREN